MDTLEWRGKARCVAYLDLILTSLKLLAVLLLTVGAGFLTANLNNPDLTSNNEDAQASMALVSEGVWITVAVAGIITFIQLYAAIKLLKGTDLAREYSDAWKNAATWRNITVVFVVIQVGGCLLSGRFLGLVSVPIHASFLYTVHNYMAELDRHRSPLEFPNMITIMKK